MTDAGTVSGVLSKSEGISYVNDYARFVGSVAPNIAHDIAINNVMAVRKVKERNYAQANVGKPAYVGSSEGATPQGVATVVGEGIDEFERAMMNPRGLEQADLDKAIIFVASGLHGMAAPVTPTVAFGVDQSEEIMAEHNPTGTQQALTNLGARAANMVVRRGGTFGGILASVLGGIAMTTGSMDIQSTVDRMERYFTMVEQGAVCRAGVAEAVTVRVIDESQIMGLLDGEFAYYAKGDLTASELGTALTIQLPENHLVWVDAANNNMVPFGSLNPSQGGFSRVVVVIPKGSNITQIRVGGGQITAAKLTALRAKLMRNKLAALCLHGEANAAALCWGEWGMRLMVDADKPGMTARNAAADGLKKPHHVVQRDNPRVLGGDWVPSGIAEPPVDEAGDAEFNLLPDAAMINAVYRRVQGALRYDAGAGAAAPLWVGVDEEGIQYLGGGVIAVADTNGAVMHIGRADAVHAILPNCSLLSHNPRLVAGPNVFVGNGGVAIHVGDAALVAVGTLHHPMQREGLDLGILEFFRPLLARFRGPTAESMETARVVVQQASANVKARQRTAFGAQLGCNGGTALSAGVFNFGGWALLLAGNVDLIGGTTNSELHATHRAIRTKRRAARMGWSLQVALYHGGVDPNVLSRCMPDVGEYTRLLPPWLQHLGYPRDVTPGSYPYGSFEVARGRPGKNGNKAPYFGFNPDGTDPVFDSNFSVMGFHTEGMVVRDARARVAIMLGDDVTSSIEVGAWAVTWIDGVRLAPCGIPRFGPLFNKWERLKVSSLMGLLQGSKASDMRSIISF